MIIVLIKKNKNCNAKGKTSKIFYSKSNPSKNTIQNNNVQENNNNLIYFKLMA